MKNLIIILVPIITAAEVFPSNSPDFTAYAIGFGGGEAGYMLTDLFTDNPYFRIVGGVGGSILAHIVFNRHFSSDGEQKWVEVGRAHWIGIRITYDLIKGFKEKKLPKATAETIPKRSNNDYDEIIVFGLEQIGD
jgi:hypothetical protein